MARAKCLTKQRDQTVMLDAWLRFHAHLFGFPNLVVHDEGSTDPDTIALLHRAERAGADICRHEATVSLEAQATSLAASAGDGIEFIVPLALDEFLAVYTEDGVSCRRDHVHAALDALEGERRAIATAPGLDSVAGRAGEFVLGLPPRWILPAGALEKGACTALLTCVRCAGVAADPRPRILFQGLGKLIDALGIGHEMFGSPVPSPRSTRADAVWVKRAPDRDAFRFGGSDLPAGDWPPLLRYVLDGYREVAHLK